MSNTNKPSQAEFDASFKAKAEYLANYIETQGWTPAEIIAVLGTLFASITSAENCNMADIFKMLLNNINRFRALDNKPKITYPVIN